MTLWRLSGYFQGFDSRNIIESTFSSKVSMSLSLSWSLVRSFQDIPVYRYGCYSIWDEIHRRISDFQKWERSPNFPPKVPMSNRVLVLAWEFLHYSKLRRKKLHLSIILSENVQRCICRNHQQSPHFLGGPISQDLFVVENFDFLNIQDFLVTTWIFFRLTGRMILKTCKNNFEHRGRMIFEIQGK